MCMKCCSWNNFVTDWRLGALWQDKFNSKKIILEALQNHTESMILGVHRRSKRTLKGNKFLDLEYV